MKQEFIENNIIILSKQTLDLLLKQESGGDLIALYVFYYYTAKWQGTNQPKATDIYVQKGMGWGYERVHKRQQELIKLGLIEKIARRDSSGKITGWFIKLNYIWKRSTLNGFVPDDPLELGVSFLPEKTYSAFQELKREGKHLIVYASDEYKCVYCGSKVKEIAELFAQGLQRTDIAKMVKETPQNFASIDHVVPISAGGTNEESNLVTACLSCNSKKGNKEASQNPENPELAATRTGFQDTNALSADKKSPKGDGAKPRPPYGDPKINEIIITLLQTNSLQRLDGSVQDNRFYARHLLNKYKTLDAVRAIIDAAVKDPFHAHNATTVRYIYYNAEKILKGAAAQKSYSFTTKKP